MERACAGGLGVLSGPCHKPFLNLNNWLNLLGLLSPRLEFLRLPYMPCPGVLRCPPGGTNQVA